MPSFNIVYNQRQNGGPLAAPRPMMRTRWLLLAWTWSLASAAPSLHLQMTEQELRHYFGTTELAHIQGGVTLQWLLHLRQLFKYAIWSIVCKLSSFHHFPKSPSHHSFSRFQHCDNLTNEHTTLRLKGLICRQISKYNTQSKF